MKHLLRNVKHGRLYQHTGMKVIFSGPGKPKKEVPTGYADAGMVCRNFRHYSQIAGTSQDVVHGLNDIVEVL